MNAKPTMIEVTDPDELKTLGRLTLGGDLSVPFLVVDQHGKCFALADEYRAWKAGCPSTSRSEQP